MAVKLNTEFNYRYQVIGETPWEKIKTLRGFLEGRIRAAALEKVAELKYKAKLIEYDNSKKNGALENVILNLQAEILEIESQFPTQKEAFEVNKQEIKILEKLLTELYEIVEPTRKFHEDGTPYTDEEMFEANAANEFTVMIAKEIQAEIITNGCPSPAKLRNAMSNPYTFYALQKVGFIPENAMLIEGNVDPDIIELRRSPTMIPLNNNDKQKLENN